MKAGSILMTQAILASTVYKNNKYRKKTKHQLRVEKFMQGAGQKLPSKPTVPSKEVCILRARLIVEELLETIGAMGLTLVKKGSDGKWIEHIDDVYVFDSGGTTDITKVADGLADLSVVVTGTMSAFGIANKSLLEEVDANNILKLKGGFKDPKTGKFRKPPGHVPPDFNKVLKQQGWKNE